MTRYRNQFGQDLKQKINYWGAMAIPIAFINGLYFGGYITRKVRQWGLEDGPMD